MKKAHREKNAAKRRPFGVYTTTVIIGVLVVGMFATLIAVVWQKSTMPVRTDYEGTIVDRWADYSESTQGSRPGLALVVESADRKRFTVRVDANVYESAKVGMRIRSKAGEIVLIDSGQRTTGDK